MNPEPYTQDPKPETLWKYNPVYDDRSDFTNSIASITARHRLVAILITKSPSPYGGLAEHSVVPSLMESPSRQVSLDFIKKKEIGGGALDAALAMSAVSPPNPQTP